MPMGKPCKYKKDFICFKWGEECLYPSLLDCLKFNVIYQLRELEHLKSRKMEKHTGASVKWRNTAFYYKKKAKYLEAFCNHHGLEVPHISELAKIFSEVKAKESVDSIFEEIRSTKGELKKGDNDDKVFGNGADAGEREGFPDNTGNELGNGGESGEKAV